MTALHSLTMQEISDVLKSEFSTNFLIKFMEHPFYLTSDENVSDGGYVKSKMNNITSFQIVSSTGSAHWLNFS